MKFRPLGDRVVVRRVAEDQKTPGGIIIPDTAQEKPQEGEVISVGPGALDENGKRVVPEVKAGDFVLFALQLLLDALYLDAKFGLRGLASFALVERALDIDIGELDFGTCGSRGEQRQKRGSGYKPISHLNGILPERESSQRGPGLGIRG